MDKYYTPEQVAEILLVKPRTVRRWLRDSELIGNKVSNQWRISHKNLQDFKSKNSKLVDFSINELAEILNVEESIIKTWVKNSKLKGRRVEGLWLVTKDNLMEALPEADFTFSEFFSEEEMKEKLVSQIPNQDKVFKALYPEEYERRHEHEKSCQSTDTALTRYHNQCQEDLERRFPHTPPLENMEDNPRLAIWSFYENKFEEELMKLDRLASKLKEKHGVPEEDLAEIKRTYENLQLLKIGIILSDVSHL